MTFQGGWPIWIPQSLAYDRMLEAVCLSIQCGNSTSAYVYARIAARLALDTVCERGDGWIASE